MPSKKRELTDLKNIKPKKTSNEPVKATKSNIPQTFKGKLEWLEQGNLLQCSSCMEVKLRDEYYNSYSDFNKGRGKLPICKECLWKYCKSIVEEQKSVYVAMSIICRFCDIPYYQNVLEGSIKEYENKGNTFNEADVDSCLGVIKLYFKSANSLHQYEGKVYRDSDSNATEMLGEKAFDVKMAEVRATETDADEINKKRVIHKLGYDPFERDSLEDRKFLFAKLNSMLTDDVLNDETLVSSIVQATKTANQIDKLDLSFSMLSQNPEQTVEKAPQLKTLTDVKDKLTKGYLNTLKEAGLSAGNNSKNEGLNSLSGRVKRLNEKGFESAELNKFDIETSQSMLQVAEISAKAWSSQVVLGENEYVDMIAEQADNIRALTSQVEESKEQIRLLKIRLHENNLPYDDITFDIKDVLKGDDAIQTEFVDDDEDTDDKEK